MFDSIFVPFPLHHGTGRARLAAAFVAAALVALALAACGSSSGGGSARTLLKQTFSGAHRVNSGVLRFALSVDPTGSSTLTQPISLSFGGPFQSLGAGKLPKSDFAVTFSVQGQSGSVSIVSTGTSGYVTLSGTSYQLPAASFRQLESSFSSIASSGGASGGSGSGALSKLGINPLGWLQDPTVVGQETVGGTQTTHIRAGVNVAALLRDLNTFLGKAGSIGVSGAGRLPHSLTAAQQARIASAIQSPTFDVWTGTSDKTMRRVRLGLTLPVTGQISTLLGGMKSAAISLTLEYSQLNTPQSINAPTNLRPYSEFSSRLATLVRAVESGLVGAATGTTPSGAAGSSGSGSAGTASGASGAGAAQATSAYSRCVNAAGNDITKLQQCASLLNGQG